MTNSFDDMRKAKEGSYFEKKNREALERLARKVSDESARLSPVTGEPMKQEVFHGVVIDRCEQSGGIWLDAGELEQIYEALKQEKDSEDLNWVSDFFRSLSGK